MKIAVPVASNEGLNALLGDSFGRSDYFAIIELENTSLEFIANPARQENSGAGIKAVQAVAEAGVEAIVVPRLGAKAIAALKDAGITAFECSGTHLERAIEAFRAGELSEFSPEGCGHKH
ncbi:MAG: NifB/NifX family molybdenum-iron cluster-binding protein [Cyanobacteria bacterium SID2]|nr:NifB/NifX family molybdenum-iron cluster-binding protein [Cyanobacteria bacterium SID2]MBP0002428.1 NifB/NifX family molybdenum-iron cluster-binding protein [Cyanobacteria bacterium SBC]